MKNKIKYYLTILLLTLVSSSACSSDDKTEEFEIPPHLTIVQKAEGAIRLMSYNVAVFNRDPNDPMNYQTIANMVNEKEVDVVCLNELDSCTTRTDRDYQLEKFANIIGGWDFKYGSAIQYSGGTYGEGIATKEKAVKKFTVALPKGVGAEARVLVVMEMKDYVIATTHLDHVSAEAQLGQVKVINEVIAQHYKDSTKPVFLGGDLNTKPDSETMKLFLENNWKIVSSTQPTFPSNKPTSCIDHFLQYENGVECEIKHAEVIRFFKSGNAATASDHLPTIVDIKIIGKK